MMDEQLQEKLNRAYEIGYDNGYSDGYNGNIHMDTEDEFYCAFCKDGFTREETELHDVNGWNFCEECFKKEKGLVDNLMKRERNDVR